MGTDNNGRRGAVMKPSINKRYSIEAGFSYLIVFFLFASSLFVNTPLIIEKLTFIRDYYRFLLRRTTNDKRKNLIIGMKKCIICMTVFLGIIVTRQDNYVSDVNVSILDNLKPFLLRHYVPTQFTTKAPCIIYKIVYWNYRP